MAKFKTGSAELEMLNDMINRDIDDLHKKLYPKGIGDAVKIAAAYPRYIVIMQHVGRHDLYEELGADVKKYGELIEKELGEAKKLPFGAWIKRWKPRIDYIWLIQPNMFWIAQ